jgi:hypothetical protein
VVKRERAAMRRLSPPTASSRSTSAPPSPSPGSPTPPHPEDSAQLDDTPFAQPARSRPRQPDDLVNPF